MWFYLALLSAFFNAFANIARRTHGSLAQPAELAWWCLLFGLPLGIGLVMVSNEPLWTSTAYIIPATAVSILNSVGSILMFRAYKYGEASVVSPIGNLLPIFLLLTSFIILGVVPSALGLVGILLIAAGVYYSSVSGKHGLLHPLEQILRNKGSRAMLLWVGLMSVSTVLTKISLESASSSYLLMFQTILGLVIMSVYLMVTTTTRKKMKRGEKVIRRWGWHLAAISVFSTIAIFFQFKAMSMIDPNYVMSVKRLDVLLTVVLAGLFLGEHHILRRFKGSAIAVVGVVIIFLAA